MEELWFKIKFYLVKLAYFRKRSRLRRYTLPIILVFLIFSLSSFIPEAFFKLVHTQTISFFILILVVTAASWYGGLGPGLLSTALVVVVDSLTLAKEDLMTHTDSGNQIVWGIYLLVGFLISVVSEARYEAEIQKDDFISLLSHELKNPLSSIIGFSKLLSLSKKLSKGKISLYTQQIAYQSNKMLELINDLLDVTKIEVGKFVYTDELFDFADLVQEAINHQKVISPQREIKLKGKCDQIIRGDRYRIGQVMTNLLTNALKYSHEKSQVEVLVKGNKKRVSLAVKDYGIGIPKEEQRTIFNRYYRARGAQRGKVEGVGLGLFISNQIVKAHQGKLWVQSNKGRGCTFCLMLPLGY